MVVGLVGENWFYAHLKVIKSSSARNSLAQGLLREDRETNQADIEVKSSEKKFYLV